MLAFVAGRNALASSGKVYGTVIGIDLGTTYSCVAVYQGGRVDIIANDQGNRITPSWVGFHGGERLIGDAAKQAFHAMPSQTIFDAKRLLGRRLNDISLLEDMRRWPFKVVDNRGRPAVEVQFQGVAKIFTPQEISAMILKKLKETAEGYLGHPVTHAVITVPAYFNDEQRQATKDAGEIAELNVLRIINEPTAAAIAYGLDRSSARGSNMIVYDLGGGTFDVSLLRVGDGLFEVLATAGDTHLGGEDFDNRVIDYLVDRYQKQTTVNVTKNQRAMSKLKREVEKAKRVLSSQFTTTLEVESLEGGNDFSFTLTRAKFEELNLDLFKKTLKPVARVLGDARLEAKDVNDVSCINMRSINYRLKFRRAPKVVLVGGSTRIPIIRHLLKDFFGGLEPRMGINPDEAVAYGAAIQGSILAGENPFDAEMVPYTELCPHTLGVKTAGGVSSELIPRGTRIPVRKSQVFLTAADNQRSVFIQVLQGESTVAADNDSLGNFTLSGILPAARGVPQIEVTFEVDINGLLTVTARDKDGGNQESINITSERNQLAKSEISDMIQESRAFSQADREARARSAALNDFQQMVATKRSQLGDKYQNTNVYAQLEEHLQWAERSGGLATLAEIRHRVAQLEELQAEPSTTTITEKTWHATMIDDMKPTSTALVPKIPLGHLSPASHAETPGTSACANPLILHKDL
ncbi:ATPase with role in protein import into the ER [Ceratobasidium sp. 428]|nr:ATPase with role in protein import into the ER [Ceratobasidium sp. 428]